MAKGKDTITSLATMLGKGGSFEAQGKTYTVKPLKIKDVDDFMTDDMSLGSQLFNVSNEKNKKKTDRWLKDYATNDKDEPMSVEKAMNDDWDLEDLRNFFKKLCDLSG